MRASPLILYDGECGFCDRWVRFVLKHDRLGTFCFAPLQGETGKSLLSEYGGETGSVVLIADGRAYRKSAAVIQVLTGLGGLWRLAAYALRAVPASIRDRVYDLVARHRHRLGPSPDACPLPSPTERARFLE